MCFTLTVKIKGWSAGQGGEGNEKEKKNEK
jgi:hypothetical protein